MDPVYYKRVLKKEMHIEYRTRNVEFTRRGFHPPVHPSTRRPPSRRRQETRSFILHRDRVAVHSRFMDADESVLRRIDQGEEIEWRLRTGRFARRAPSLNEMEVEQATAAM